MVSGDAAAGAHPRRATEVLQSISRTGAKRISLGTVIDQLGDRAHGLALLILALPCCVPFIYGIPQIVSVPMMFLAAQLARDPKRLWLPDKLRARTFERDSYETMVRRAHRPLSWFERISRPRLPALVSPRAERVLGGLMVVFSVSIAIPLPSTNTVPGMGVALISLGLIERDGLLVLAGTIVGTLWIAALVFFGATFVSLLAGWITGG